MKHGFIQQGRTAKELFRVLQNFDSYGVTIENVLIGTSFDEFIKNVERGDVIVVDSYSDIFGGLNDMLSRLIELFEQGVTIESYSEPALRLSIGNIETYKTLLTVGSKVKATRTLQYISKARQSGVKLGRPPGTTKVNKKVEMVTKLHKNKGLSISKACKEVGCNPRTHYRHISELRS